MHEGSRGSTRDKTRPSRIPPLPAATIDRVVALTNQEPPHEATHWIAPAMAKAVGIRPSSVRRIWKGHGVADLVQTDSLGLSVASATKRLMAVCSSTIEVKTPRLRRYRVSLENQPSTALAQEHDVGARRKVRRGWRAS